MAQHEELNILRDGRAAQEQDQSEHLPKASNTATAATRRDHDRPAITAGQRPTLDF